MSTTERGSQATAPDQIVTLAELRQNVGESVYPTVLGNSELTSTVPLFTSPQTAGWQSFETFLRVEGAKLIPFQGDSTLGINAVNVKPDGGSSSCNYRTMLAGSVPGPQKIALEVQTYGGNDIWAWIDGKPTTPESVINTETGRRYSIVTTPDMNPHEVTFATALPVRSITCELSGYMYPPGPRPLRIAILGDSYVIGSENMLAGGMGSLVGLMHGWEVYNLGQGSTGFSAVLPAGSTDGRTKYADTGATGRLQQIKALYDAGKIDRVATFGSINDGDTDPVVYGGDVATVFTYLQENCPNLPVDSFGPVGIGRTENTNALNEMLAAQAALFAKVKHTPQYDWFRASALIPGTPHLNRAARRIQAGRVGAVIKERVTLAV